MKTAVTISDELFRRVEKTAKKRKISRSQLFTEAVKSFLDDYDEKEIIAQINKVCEKVDTSVDPMMLKMATLSLPNDQWWGAAKFGGLICPSR